MPELVLKLKSDQIVEMIKSLDENEKLKILKFLEDTLWGKRFKDLTKSLRKKAKGKLSLREITKEVEKVRKEMYESRHRH